MDWADEKVEWLFDDKKLGEGCPHGLLGTACRDCIAQALRDVQRETAEECLGIVDRYILVPKPGTDQSGCGPSIIRQQKVSSNAIRERFLKEKP